MKLRFKLFPIFLSIMIVLLSLLQCSLTVYASSSGIHTDKDKAILNKFFEDGKYYATYWITQLGAIFSDYSFSKVMENKATWEDYWNGENIIVDADSRTVTFSDDLMSAFKQALLEVAEEENGFKMIPTTNYLSVPPTFFKNSYSYRTFMALVQESECLSIRDITKSELMACRPFNAVDTPISLVNTKYYFRNLHDVMFVGTYSWEVYRPEVFTFDSMVYDTDKTLYYQEYHSFIEGTPLSNTNVYASLIGYEVMNHGSFSEDSWILYSTDGRKLKVFSNMNALKNYTTGNRSVYFGSGFYDDPGEIQVSFDDLEKYIDGKYDSFFDDLKDLIGDNEDNLTEEDLEKLVDKILDKMDDIGGGNQGGSSSDDSSIWEGISDIFESMTSTISGYLDAILMYLQSILTDLDYIVMEMQDMTEDEVSTKTDSVLTELKDTFSDVGDMMTKKFPFCIPWDMKRLFVTLNGGKDYSGEEAAMLLSGDDIEGYASATPETPDFPTFSGYTGSGKLVDVIIYSSPLSRGSPSSGDSGIMLLSEDDAGNDTISADAGVYRSESGAPVFHIPFVLNSIGLNSALVIDMSPFDGISDISRTLFLLIFIYQLILLSIRITEFLEGFIG